MTERPTVWFRPLWLGLLIAAIAALTTGYTCITPFAAFAVIAAITLSRRDAVILAVALWLTNQAVGFGVLNYPWTASTFAWGVAIGAAAVIATLTAHWAVGRLAAFHILARAAAGLVAAFVFYEVALYAVAVSMLGGTEAFAPAIVGQVLFANAVTLVGLVALHQLVVVGAAVLSRRRRAQASPARLA
jgi:hypothetical protein